MSEEYVTVATCAQSYEAEIIRGRLESEGITVRIPAPGWEHVYMGEGGNVFGGVRVQVLAPDEMRAKDILNEHVDLSDVDSDAPWRCPACGSDSVEVAPVSRGVFSMLQEILCGMRGVGPAQTYRCGNCGREWTD